MEQRIRQEVASRDINRLLHFTHIGNLDGILEHGLVSRERLEAVGAGFYYNDTQRGDNQRSAVCCSIEHPNYKLFSKNRQESDESEWIIIAISKEVLWQKDCLFCPTNAANSCFLNVPVGSLRGPEAFQALFFELGGQASRNSMGLCRSWPTDPQAEIQVLETIESRYIYKIYTESISRAVQLRKRYPSLMFEYEKTILFPRPDYEYWQSNDVAAWR